jgi:hypothetical protein
MEPKHWIDQIKEPDSPRPGPGGPRAHRGGRSRSSTSSVVVVGRDPRRPALQRAHGYIFNLARPHCLFFVLGGSSQGASRGPPHNCRRRGRNSNNCIDDASPWSFIVEQPSPVRPSDCIYRLSRSCKKKEPPPSVGLAPKVGVTDASPSSTQTSVNVSCGNLSSGS